MPDYDMDELAAQLAAFVRKQAAVHMPQPVIIEVIEASQQFDTGVVQARHAGRTVRCLAPGPVDLSGATEDAPATILAFPPNPDEPGAFYVMIGLLSANGDRHGTIYGSGATGSFTTADSKTVTVVNGIITDIS